MQDTTHILGECDMYLLNFHTISVKFDICVRSPFGY